MCVIKEVEIGAFKIYQLVNMKSGSFDYVQQLCPKPQNDQVNTKMNWYSLLVHNEYNMNTGVILGVMFFLISFRSDNF